MASARLKCNSTHGYHCVPNKQFTSLIEFCYPKGYKFPFEAGNCLELASDGVLNQVSCDNTFSDGCPKKHYFSDGLFNYPKCLIINTWLRCFDADYKCVLSGLMKNKTVIEKEGISITRNSIKGSSNQCSNTERNENSTTVITALAVMLALCVAALVIVSVVITCMFTRRCDQLKYALIKDCACCASGQIEERLHENTIPEVRNYEDANPPDYATLLLEDSVNQQNGDRTCSTSIQKYKTKSVQTKNYYDENDSAFKDEPPISTEKKEPKGLRIENLQKLHNLIVHGEDQEFVHFSQEFDKESLEKLNHRGLNSLHLSAKSGNLNIFKQILKLNVNIETLTTDGRNSLHIAAFCGSPSICTYILDCRKDLFDVTDRYNMNPAHWAALAGQHSILELLSEHGCNLSLRTPKYEENIVLFACIGESYNVCNFVGRNKDITDLLHATNSEGWNSIQYAAKSGNLEVFRYLCDMKVNIRNRSKQTGKNCLHTACEKGNIEICRYILEERNERTLITQLDKHEQHVGHYAAKSGNIEILELLIKKLSDTAALKPALLENATTDNINILHIACRHARVDMCVKIADTFPDLISEITERGWNAALFITEKAGAEKDRIMILNFLKIRGLNIYHVTRSGKTILYNACVNRSAKLVKYLLDNYPDLLNIEKSMDPRKAANSEEIEDVFRKHLDMKVQK